MTNVKEVSYSYWVSEMIWWRSSENRTLKSVKNKSPPPLTLTNWVKVASAFEQQFPVYNWYPNIYWNWKWSDLQYPNIQKNWTQENETRRVRFSYWFYIGISSIVVVYLRPLMSDSQLGLPFQLVDFKTAGLATGDTIKEGFDKDDDDRINADLSATLMEVWAGGEYACPMYFVRSSRTCFLRRPPPSPLLFCYPTICPVNLQLWLPRSRAGLVLTLC